MAEKIGLVIFGDTLKQNGFILEEGGGKQVYPFDPQTVGGNIDLDPQARQYPARLTGRIVKFTVDEKGTVATVSTLMFKQSVHDECSRGAIRMAVKYCACGNTTNSFYKHCDVCAIKNNQCVRCGKPLP